MSDVIDRARLTMERYRKTAQTASDAGAALSPELFSAWSGQAVPCAVGDRRQHKGLLYKCLTAHQSQAGWAPDAAPSLWVRIDDPAVEWPDWRQPTGATDAYPMAAKVSHAGKRWISDVANNVWEPGISGWTAAG